MSELGPAHLDRRLGLWASMGVVIGITIGSGIFRTPASIAARVADPPQMLLVWVAGGAITLCGALSFAELAAAFPRTGGMYVFLREGWGRLAAFLFGWSELVLIRASAGGALATVFSEYFLRALGVDLATSPNAAHYVAAVALIVAAAINVSGVQLAAAITGISTAGKFGALLLLVLASFAWGGAAGASGAHFTSTGATAEPALFGLALISVLWAYDGFVDLTYAAGEVRNPHRTLPVAIVIGTIAITAIYLLTNAAYLYVSPVAAIATSPLIAADTLQAVLGRGAVTLVSAVVALSTFGALVATMLAAPRILFAMAEDGLLFSAVSRVHPRYRTPYVAIALSAGLGVVFVLTRTFEQLADTFVLAIWPFYGLAIAGMYRLRRASSTTGTYRVPGYPVVPAIFIAAVVYLVGNAVVADPLWTGVTFAIVLAGIPVFWTTTRRANR